MQQVLPLLQCHCLWKSVPRYVKSRMELENMISSWKRKKYDKNSTMTKNLGSLPKKKFMGSSRGLQSYKTTSDIFWQALPIIRFTDGLVWGIQKNQCDWPTDEQCGNRPITINMKPGMAQKCNCPGGAKDCYFADINNCNGFFQCSKGKSFQVCGWINHPTNRPTNWSTELRTR